MNYVDNLVSMLQNIIDVLTHPDTFFQEKIGSAENLKIPFMFVAIAGVISAIYGYLAGSVTSRMFAQMGGGIGDIVAVSSILGAFITVVVLWLIWTAVFYLISMAFKGTGNFSRTLEFVGYGFIPQIFSSLVTLIMAVYYIPMVQVPVVRSLTDPVAIQNAVLQLMHDPAMLELTKVSAVIGIIFLLWSANIWIYAIKSGRNLSMKYAAVSVLLPVIIFIIYSLFTNFVGFPAPGGYK
jgi:hypothetical protein